MPSNMNWSFRAKKFHGQITMGKPVLNKANKCLYQRLSQSSNVSDAL